MRDEVVSRRRWLADSEFLDLLGATNLIPGPNATEMAIHIGHKRAGWLGLIGAGFCFTAPATAVTLAFAWTYVRYGSTPEISWVLYGIKPVVIGVMIQAIWNLAKPAVRSVFLASVGTAVLALYMAGFNEIALLFGAATFVMLATNVRRLTSKTVSHGVLLPMVAGHWLALKVGSATGAAAAFSMTQMFLTFLKIGSVLYGSGYVLITFLRSDFVDRLGWLSEQELLDAVAAGQVTPGPLLSTATFIGYLLGSWEGALLATLGVFLPSFVFVTLSAPLIPRMRRSAWSASVLDGVNVAALALMVGVTWQLGRAAIVDAFSAATALIGVLLLLKFRVNTSWLVLLGASIGFAYKAIFDVGA
jgi:chromate transporter